MEKTHVRGKVNECCQKDENLERQPSLKPELIIQKCKVCGRNQYRLLMKEVLKGLTLHKKTS